MFQISLRQLLILVAAIALAIVSLKFASPNWLTFAVTLAMFAFFAATVVSTVDRGPRQAYALGFALVMLCYGIFVHNGAQSTATGGFGGMQSTNREFNAYLGRLPTTRLLGAAYQAVVKHEFVDERTGKPVPNYDPAAMPNVAITLASVSPIQDDFMAAGHCWWALLFGYLGGHFARYVYLRRMKEQSDQARG